MGVERDTGPRPPAGTKPGTADGLPSRVLDKISPEPNTGCWLWTGSLNRGGYGMLWAHNKRGLAHRMVYLMSGKTIPDGLQLDHLCRVRNCVNPDHLRPVTQRENILRGSGMSTVHAAKSCCPKCGGSYHTLKSNGQRRCRACKNEINRLYATRKRASI